MAAGDVTSRSRRGFGVAVAAAAVAAVALGAFRIGSQSFWIDELFSMQVARGSWSATWTAATGHELHSALYHLASWPWVHTFGESERALRSLSVLFGAATVVVLMVLARRLFGTRAALLTAPLFLVHAQTVHYFQEARTYSLAMLASSVVTLVFLHALDDRESTRRWLLYAAVAGVGLYAHLFVAFVVAAHAAVVVLHRLWPSRRAIVATLAVLAVAVSPLLVFSTRGYGNVDWIQGTTVTAVRTAFVLIVLGGGNVIWLLPVVALWVWRVWVARRDADDRLAISVVVMWLVVPFVLAVAVSTVKPLFVAYYLNVCVPAAALLTAAGIDALAKRSRALAGFGLAVALLHSGRLLVNWYDGVPPKDDYRTAMAFACRDAGNDGKVLYATGLSPARYYAAPECGTTTGAQRLLMIVRTTDARPPIVGWVARQTRSFTGVDVVTYVPASAPS